MAFTFPAEVKSGREPTQPLAGPARSPLLWGRWRSCPPTPWPPHTPPPGSARCACAIPTTPGRSAMGRSLTRTSRRPCATALVPHASQPPTSAVVSTANHHLELRSGDEAVHSQKSGRALTRVHPHRGLPFVAAFDSRNNGEAPQCLGGPLCDYGLLATHHASSRRDTSLFSLRRAHLELFADEWKRPLMRSTVERRLHLPRHAQANSDQG